MLHTILKALKGFVVVTGAIFLSTLAINAADSLKNPSNSMLAGALSGISKTSQCPDGMVYVGLSGGGYCIDAYENSPGEKCISKNPNKEETRRNLETKECVPVSAKDAMPWRNISRDQAAAACALAGKRLPTNEEWFAASLGTPDPNENWGISGCNVSKNRGEEVLDVAPAGTGSSCVSALGAYDMSGNVWEWVKETVKDGKIDGLELPDQGYVTSSDERGLPSATDPEFADDAYRRDRYWIKKDGVSAIFRGGFFGSGSDAGIYTVHAGIMPSFSGAAVGFRCVK